MAILTLQHVKIHGLPAIISC